MHLLTNMHFLDESPEARIGQMFPDFGDLEGDGISSPEETMMPKLSILSSKGENVGFQSDTEVDFECLAPQNPRKLKAVRLF